MPRAFISVGVPPGRSEEVRTRLKNLLGPHLINTFTSDEPDIVGLSVEAETVDELFSIRSRLPELLNMNVRILDFFIEPTSPNVRGLRRRTPVEATDSLRQLAQGLRMRNPRIATVTLPPQLPQEIQEATDELLKLNFDWIADLLGSRGFYNELQTADRDELIHLAHQMSEVFMQLAQSYAGMNTVKEGLAGLSEEFMKLRDYEGNDFLARFRHLVNEIGELSNMRRERLRSARQEGFEDDFLRRLQGGGNSNG